MACCAKRKFVGELNELSSFQVIKWLENENVQIFQSMKWLELTQSEVLSASSDMFTSVLLWKLGPSYLGS